MQYPCYIFIRKSVKITHCDSVILKWKVPGGGGGVGGAKQPPFAMVTSSIAISPDQDLPLTPSNVTWTWKKIISLHTCTIGKKDLDTNSWMEPFRAFSLVLQKFDQISNNLSACMLWPFLTHATRAIQQLSTYTAISGLQSRVHEKSWR